MGEAKRRLERLAGEIPGMYARENPAPLALLEAWKTACDKGFALGGRGALIRMTSEGLGKAAYFALDKIDDPTGQKIVAAYDPEKEYVVAEPNEKGGTRWQILTKDLEADQRGEEWKNHLEYKLNRKGSSAQQEAVLVDARIRAALDNTRHPAHPDCGSKRLLENFLDNQPNETFNILEATLTLEKDDYCIEISIANEADLDGLDTSGLSSQDCYELLTSPLTFFVLVTKTPEFELGGFAYRSDSSQSYRYCFFGVDSNLEAALSHEVLPAVDKAIGVFLLRLLEAYPERGSLGVVMSSRV